MLCGCCLAQTFQFRPSGSNLQIYPVHMMCLILSGHVSSHCRTGVRQFFFYQCWRDFLTKLAVKTCCITWDWWLNVCGGCWGEGASLGPHAHVITDVDDLQFVEEHCFGGNASSSLFSQLSFRPIWAMAKFTRPFDGRRQMGEHKVS